MKVDVNTEHIGMKGQADGQQADIWEDSQIDKDVCRLTGKLKGRQTSQKPLNGEICIQNYPE